MVRAAVVVGVLAVLAAGAVLATTVTGGSRPEEAVARIFLRDFFAGRAQASYAATTRGYRSIVLPADHARLVAAVRGVVGDDVTVEILGTERRAGARPTTSLVGYTGRTAVGEVEGVVTLVRDGGASEGSGEPSWQVRDVGYKFPDAPPGTTVELDRITRQLNQQLERRLAPSATPDG